MGPESTGSVSGTPHGVSQLVAFVQTHPLAQFRANLASVEPGKYGYKVEAIAEMIEMVAWKTIGPTVGPTARPANV
jgi:hypothetical protein